MKLYTHEPVKIIRLQITRLGEGKYAEYLNLIETTAKETEAFIKKLIEKQHLSPFQTGRVTSIVIREAVGAKNGKSNSISFKGLSPKEVHDLILKNIPS